MGIYNPQMKMPKGCHRCDYYDSCKVSNKSIGRYNGERCPDCPLVEVKTPHGRLVDIRDINELMNRYKYDDFDHIDYHTPTVIKAEESE